MEIIRIIGILCVRLSVELFGLGPTLFLIGRDRLYMLHSSYMHGGRLYRHDPRNRMISTCWFVVTGVMMGPWSLRLHAVKYTSVHNCPGWRTLTRYARGGGLNYVIVGVYQG